ncbi:MAG: pyridoxamine kinase [Clostridiales Family XIII bacterium]|jgi:pyridoxine kinase|nr:pyridoxamine kinase [Clostridiales Family XIII bacterium]
MQKQVAAIHDISGFGRCSLTVALPVLSATGIQTSVMPTAVLSTHTGGFTGFTYRDLSDDILPIARHWSALGLTFDAIYTGFLASSEQVDLVIDAIGLMRSSGTVVVVDPVMADFGKLYTIFDDNFPVAMRRLCAEADVIVPNITEAALLAGVPYREGPFLKREIQDMVLSLACMVRGDALGVVLTGVMDIHDPDTIGAASYDVRTDEFAYDCAMRIEPMYHGTGDVFASVLTAAIVNGRTLADSCSAAVRYTVDSILRTKAAGTDNRYGVDFESGLHKLRELIFIDDDRHA